MVVFAVLLARHSRHPQGLQVDGYGLAIGAKLLISFPHKLRVV